jgi:L-threonylcarbamoyladenylate synthase
MGDAEASLRMLPVGAHRSPVVPATAETIEAAAAALRAGRLVAFPTETVYGLGADARNDQAVAAIFEAKGRPRFNPLIVHFPDTEAAGQAAVFNRDAVRLAETFWPGPLTLVLPRGPMCELSLLVSAGLDTVAVRVPTHPVARRLLRAAFVPIAAPSANRSGEVSPTTAAHVEQSLGERVDLILDGGPCPVGIESTVVDLTAGQPTLLRAGAVTLEELAKVVGPLRTAAVSPDAPRSPGMLARHYAPSRPLRTDATDVRPGEALLAFGAGHPHAEMNLSPTGDLREAAANLFAMIRALDRPEFTGIAVTPIPAEGLGLAINDRLRRAGAPCATDDEWNDERGPAAPCLAVNDPDGPES